jgi:hypothetical protein
VAAPRKVTALSDEFAVGYLDPTKWTVRTGSARIADDELTTSVSLANQQTEIETVDTWDATDAELAFQMDVPTDDYSLNAIVQLGVDASNGVQMAVAGSNPGALRMKVIRDGVTDETRIDYDPLAHAWGRIRESGGTVYFDTSFDGIGYTNRRAVTHSLDLTHVTVTLGAFVQAGIGFGLGPFGSGPFGGG